MMSLTFGLFTQVSGSGPLGPLVLISMQIISFASIYEIRLLKVLKFWWCFILFIILIFMFSFPILCLEQGVLNGCVGRFFVYIACRCWLVVIKSVAANMQIRRSTFRFCQLTKYKNRTAYLPSKMKVLRDFHMAHQQEIDRG